MRRMRHDRPSWLEELNDEDLQFIKRFVFASGSLKELARLYSVSYPTMRARLDRLIAKVKAAEHPEPHDPFERKVRILVADGRLPAELAKELMAAHKTSTHRRHLPSAKGAQS